MVTVSPRWFRAVSGRSIVLVLLSLGCLSAPTASAAESVAPAGAPLLLQDLNPGATGSGPRAFARVGDVALFPIDLDPAGPGPALWRTDGTPGGTFRLETPGAAVNFVNFLWVTPQLAYFPAFDPGTHLSGLWRTDGSAAGTVPLVSGLSLPSSFAGQRGYLAERRRLVFTAGPQEVPGTGAGIDWEPWVSDGTIQGTHRLLDLFADGPSMPFGYSELGGELYFAAFDDAAAGGGSGPRSGLWKTDGTAAGTRLVAHPLSGGGVIRGLWTAGPFVYLAVTTPDGHIALWRSDGTPSGTAALRDFGAGAIRQVLPFGVTSDGKSLFTAWTSETPAGLWVTDGTLAGTRQLTPLAVGDGYDLIIDPFPAENGDRVYFIADDGHHGRELWETDGTPQGTLVAFESCPGACSDLGSGLYDAGERLVFPVRRDDTGFEPWVSDGTTTGTALLADLCPGPCSATPYAWRDLGGVHLFALASPSPGRPQLWMTDLTADGTQQITDLPGGVGGRLGFPSTLLPEWLVFAADDGASGVEPWALPLDAADPPVPPGVWLQSPAVPGFELKVRITSGSGSIAGEQVPICIPETVCVSGAVPGRSEVFLRVVGPKPNGRLWPTLVKFSTSTVEVWVRQDGTGETRYYRLEGARPGHDELPGLFDRDGFVPLASGAALQPPPGVALAEPLVLAAGEAPPPSGPTFTSEHFPDFRFRVRISAGDQEQAVRRESACIEETLCLSGAVPGRSEVFLRIVGPKPNGRLWPTIVKFTTSTLEVWIEQVSTGTSKYYRIEGAAPGHDDLTGLFDRDGFPK